MDDKAVTLEDIVKQTDYRKLSEGYIPTEFAIKFVNFIKLVNGESGEENKSPLFHYDILDTIHNSRNTLIVAYRGSAKTSLMEYLCLYLAVFGKLDNFGDVSVAMYVGDTMENGCKNFRANIEHRYRHSDFLQKFIPTTRFTDVEMEFVNSEGHQFCTRLFGASTGVRGFKKYGLRPQLACHKKGTIVTTEYGTHRVEDYPGTILPTRVCKGLNVQLYGLVDTETVTPEHRYLCRTMVNTRHKEYLPNGKTNSTTTQKIGKLHWLEARDLKFKKSIGNQSCASDYIAKKIDYEVSDVQPILYNKVVIADRDEGGKIVSHYYVPVYHVCENMLHDSFWWLYGIWLANGDQRRNSIGFTLNASQKKKYIIDTFLDKARDCGLVVSSYVANRPGCLHFTIYSRPISRWLRETHTANAVKDMPEWVLKLNPDKQKQILLGYIAGDGYLDYKRNQVRINSVNLNVLKQLGIIAERLGLPYHIRNTKKSGHEIFPNRQICAVRQQWEIRFRDNVRKILNIDIDDNPRDTKDCFIEDGYLYRRFKSATPTDGCEEFIPINTPSHTYQTDFGVSHNCLDDLLSDKSAESKTIIRDIENVIYKAVRQAMHPTKRKVIWIGTPFNKKDPLYNAAGTSAWVTRAYPIAMEFPCKRSDFVGAWEDRFPYDAVKTEYKLLKDTGKLDAFNQELMLRILSDDDRLVLDEDIVWYHRADILNRLQECNIYMTTDFATSENERSDYSVISVWALNHKGVFHWIDGIVKRQDMAKNVDDVFRFVELYSPLATGVEISGQQKGFVSWLKREMVQRGVYFYLASDKTSGEEGLRPNTSKLTRFNTALPLFKQRKIAFPLELKDSDSMLEFMDELLSVTPSGFKSAHDDCADTVSQLPLLDYFTPMDPRYMKGEEKPIDFGNQNYYFTEPKEEERSSYIV